MKFGIIRDDETEGSIDGNARTVRMKAGALRSRHVASDAESDGYVLEEQIGFVLRRAHQRHVAIFAESMAELGLTPTQFSALAKIRDEGPVSQNRLGRLTSMDPANILGVV